MELIFFSWMRIVGVLEHALHALASVTKWGLR